MGVKIVRLSAENVKRLEAVEITPEGNLVVVGGKNGSGKSSLLDSIMYALAGAKSIPSKPIRTGADAATITVDLDGDKKLTVHRRITKSGPTLTIKTAEGYSMPSPQKILDDLCGKIAFDPLAFLALKPDKQAETLRGLVGLDFDALEAKRAALYMTRTDVNRDVKNTKAQVDASQQHPDAPEKLVSVSALMAELEARQKANRANDLERNGLESVRGDYKAAQQDVRAQEVEVANLERKLASAKQRLTELRQTEEDRLAALNTQEAVVEALTDADVDEVHRQIADSEEVNRKVRANQSRAELVATHERYLAQSKDLTAKIEAIDQEKQAQLESAVWPVPGLGFDEAGVTFNGLPFEQASSAEQLRVSVAMGLAMNPTLRVLLVRDGSLLDEDSLRAIAEQVKKADAQLWLERVGEGDDCSVVIVDGRIKAPEKDPQKTTEEESYELANK